MGMEEHSMFVCNSDCAKNGLGSDMNGDERWLRITVSDMVSTAQAPDFAVIFMAANALGKRPRTSEPMEMPEITSVCQYNQ